MPNLKYQLSNLKHQRYHGPMHISWHGHYTIRIQTSSIVALIDPHGSPSGLKPYRGKADVIVLSNPTDESMSESRASEDTRIINTPGEYAIDGITIYAHGWEANDGSERSLQRWHVDGLTLLHVGALNRDLTDKELEIIQAAPIDILLLPIGGGSSLDLKGALDLLTKIEPRVVIPIHFKIPGAKEKLDSVEHFAKEMGVDPKNAEAKAILKSGKLPEDDLEVMILSP